MNEKIIQELKDIEKAEKVCVLFACESGSRMWGFPSTDSDYDIRFIYIHRPEWYLSIYEGKDVIEKEMTNSLDISGWDIRKALKLFRKSNPPLLEWLSTDLVYLEQFDTAQKMRDLIKQTFSPITSIHHYFHMADGNYRDYLQDKKVKIKKYFYVLRPLLACKWIEQYKSIPPVEFKTLMDQFITEPQLKKDLEELLERKIRGEELESENQVPSIQEYTKKEIMYYSDLIKYFKYERNPVEIEELDNLFRDTLKNVWQNNSELSSPKGE